LVSFYGLLAYEYIIYFSSKPTTRGAEESIVIIPLSFVTEKNIYIYGNFQKDAYICNIFYISIIYYKVLYIIVIDVIWIWIY
jgi:hypothetical protein